MSKENPKRKLFAMLPSVDEVLNDKKIMELSEKLPRSIIVEAIRNTIECTRNLIVDLKDNQIDSFKLDYNSLIDNCVDLAHNNYNLSLKKVINATGIVVHTNLGRSLISESIKGELWQAASRYSNLEYDIEEGKRGSRYSHLKDMIKRLTGAEDVLVVNNNAAAVLLVLSTLAKGGQAIVSRGELVEVGGAFRIPSIMQLSGAELVEVGATNKTHYNDYEDAITDNTKVLMKVHTSNYRIMGFSEAVSLEEMRILGDKYDIPVIEDLGSGVFVNLSKYGMTYEPTIYDSINKGVDVVSFSGDKMLGGPQAGIIVGKKKYIEKMKKNQLTRALRVDKMTIATLEATLRLYLNEDEAMEKIPTLKMLTYTKEELFKKAKGLQREINNYTEVADNINIEIEECKGQVGGGSMPTEELDSYAVTISSNNISVSQIEKALRLSDKHIIARVYEDKYILDVRTIFEEEFRDIAIELKKTFGGK
ncbi:L-seryl-tRNA(Sec) selenium transferase [Peptostreptococcus equinus]|uniref:L-seryl-tRNA(Sec) selenium transferase n=1 Tax=Peptostreptococcus equinus TaxID=3003601 RepID=A0ABY7JLN5_9FIRM|nr:L-seryl-tRNA(Sec) selenium transferase [Peptostreptococcus sp. CBA3647]WAW14259.1 L-seryl-tRNA(Sec) selenium transferase [Peptostreptococcus sp. CBA3647]